MGDIIAQLQQNKDFLFKILEDKIKWSEHYCRRYHSEDYYNECLEAKRILNLIKQLLRCK